MAHPSALISRIETKDARLGVVGLGYVGLSVAAAFAEAGFAVTGVDTDAARVQAVQAGRIPFAGEEPDLPELLRAVTDDGSLRATTDYEGLASCDVILLAVETPIDSDHVPQYRALKSALDSLASVLREGALVVIESTVAPGTLDSLVAPRLAEGSGRALDDGFLLGHCPERVMPGKLMHNLRHLSRVCGGSSQAARQAMIALYRHIVEGDLDPTDCLTAELVKTAENAYRDVNIAFANELALICEAAGGDVWKVRELVNKSPGRNVLLPGAGVGGHCIPKDPWLLARPALEKGVPLRLIPAAREVNDSMPEHVVALVERGLEGIGQPVAGARVLVLGYAYRENTDDIRNSPTIDLVDLLARRGALVTVHDPFIDEYSWDLATGEGFDVAIGMVSHDIYRALAPADLRAKVVVDTRQIWPDIARPDKHGHRHIKLGGN